MSNRTEHALTAAVTVGLAQAVYERSAGRATAMPALSAALAVALASLPDWLEPPVHPHHRQFCHSWVAVGCLLHGGHRLLRWRPQDPTQGAIRYLSLIGVLTYLTHLALDAQTPRSLPLMGRLTI
jgi:hypothetical protein